MALLVNTTINSLERLEILRFTLLLLFKYFQLEIVNAMNGSVNICANTTTLNDLVKFDSYYLIGQKMSEKCDENLLRPNILSK